MNVHYVVHDLTGRIVRSGSCSKEMVGFQASTTGHSALIVDQQYDDSLFWVQNGQVVEIPEESKQVLPVDEIPEYVLKRRAAYPAIEDQLDLIYHGGLEAWREVIAGVKTSIPKP